MSDTLNAFDHKRWAEEKLQDYGEFADRTGECNQLEEGDGTSGEWFYIPDDPLPELEHEPGERRVIYHGSWGNYNSPGASSYTYATIYYMPEDQEEYEADKKKWEEAPEWAQQDMPCVVCGEEFDKDEMEYDDRQDGYVCEGCQQAEDETEDDDGDGDEGGSDGPGDESDPGTSNGGDG